MPDPFGPDWAASKLNMARRERELKKYIAANLPELEWMASGLCIDIGPGPGDAMAMFRDFGHHVIGIDAPSGRGGMGSAYQELAKKHCDKFAVDVLYCGLLRMLEPPPLFKPESCVLVHSRGSIEQALHIRMTGAPHDEHHRADMLDWITDEATEGWFRKLCATVFEMLRPGGIFLVHANGSRSTNSWYDGAVREAAAQSGLKLVTHEPPLLHKWRKPECIAS